MKDNRNTTCDPCERDFKHKVDELVREGKAPSHTDRTKRGLEVKSAFAGDHPAHKPMHDMGRKEPHASNAHAVAGKPAAKPHAMAGAAKKK